jgi:hypothetical protein
VDALDDNKDKKQAENGTEETDISNLPKFEEIIQVIFHHRGKDDDGDVAPNTAFALMSLSSQVIWRNPLVL